MAEHNQQNIEDSRHQAAQSEPAVEELDAAGKSLVEALRISFNVLKVIMAVLVIVFLASGFFTVGHDEQALVLRFGKIRGAGEQRILEPGLHWSLPYPIDEVVKIPVTKVQVLPIDEFWYFQTEKEKLADATSARKTIPPPTLDVLRDGYCVTRNDSIAAFAGNDYNIVHCKWQLTYLIYNPERFFKNIYVQAPEPGRSFADVIGQSIAGLLKSIAADTIVTTMVKFSIDEAIVSEADIAENVKTLLQDKLNQIESGIKVDSMQLTQITWPRQVDDAFQRSIQASLKSKELVTEARGYAESTLNEAGGPFVHQILRVLKDKLASKVQEEFLWARVAGTAQEKIAQARAYRTEVVESAKADAEYLKQLLPEYRRYPKLVLQKIYQDAIEEVLNNADEKMVLEPAAGKGPRQVWFRINRDPRIKAKQK